MKRYVHSAKKNTSGGEILEELTFGNIKVIYETYWHSFLQKRIKVYVGSQLIGGVTNIDNDEAADEFMTEVSELFDSYDTSGGEAGYYKYLNAHPKVKNGVVELLNTFRSELSTGQYDPVSGQRLD